MIQLAAIALILIGIYGLLIDRNIIKILVFLNIMDLGINLFIVSIGYVNGGIAPIITQGYNSATTFVDPLPQALVLTSIVIGMGITGLGLAFAKKFYAKHGTYNLDEIGGNLK
jgi:multicomponent Na+:H+ antiporter subunit C